MKQVLQNLKSGETQLTEVPIPGILNGHLLIKTNTSLISLGTERMLIEFGKAGYLKKARQQPEKIVDVINKIKTDGLFPTIQVVKSKLDTPLPLGYSNAGEVIAVGDGITKFKIGDRVVSNGTHAEVVCVPENLCAPIPGKVGYEMAAFTVVGSIALQGIRLANPTLGEVFTVTGLGLVGLLTAQILKANGCNVLGIDNDPEKLKLAQQLGIQTVDIARDVDPVNTAFTVTNGKGVDGVIITAATKSNLPVHQAAQMCRKRGRIILVGVTGLELSRSDFYEKEISFQVSCSYGPGRYDDQYELKGVDYPIGFVRWTEQRNLKAVLELMNQGALNIRPLITAEFSINDAIDAYEYILENPSTIGILLNYNYTAKSFKSSDQTVKILEKKKEKISNNRVILGLIGAGNYTKQILLPVLTKTDAFLKTIASLGGVSSSHLGEKYNFVQSTTNVDEIFNDSEINAVVISTRHDTHGELVCRALKAGKKVFVEKPLAINNEELNSIKTIISEVEDPFLTVGFNRRFSPLVIKLNELLDSVSEPKTMVMIVNAGFISDEHWVQDPSRGGGRIIGEVCHFIDLFRYLIGFPIEYVRAIQIGGKTASAVKEDKVSISIKFQDGSIGTIHYFANGHKTVPKERLEVFSSGKIFQLNNYKILKGFGSPGFRHKKMWTQDKGHRACIQAFIDTVKEDKPAPIPLEELFEVTKTSFKIMENLK
ncbi:MAG: zinc-binding dehydrogenase [Candidatus Marinimicrobia bacterium]|nr:zinc-binding dehydrogenase [Candidatus Neomarinimicrobiota bacterium]